ncbi:MAG: hypothetical protein ACTHKY_15265 [Ginsengibacter sp.]
MLKNISWTDYIITVSAIFFVYYLLISIRYYSGEIKDFFSGKQKQKFTPVLTASDKQYNLDVDETEEQLASFHNTSDDQLIQTKQLADRLKSVMADAMSKRLIPQEFKQYVSMVLKEYPSIRYSPFQSSINALIISECKKYGSAILSEDEVELLWKEAM